MSDCRKTAHPYPKSGMALAEKAVSAYVSTGTPSALGGGLEKVAVACRTLRVEPEILDAPLVQDNDFDVLPADVDDAMGVGIKTQRRLGVGYGFHQRNIGVQHVAQDILGIAGCADTKHFEVRSLRLHLLAERLKSCFVSSMGLPSES